MRESELWRHVQKRFRALPGFKYDRIESHLNAGIPDIAYSYNGHHGWIELKVFEHTRKHLTPLQRNWLKERDAAGGYCWILCAEKSGSGHIFSFIRGRDADLIPALLSAPIPAKAYFIRYESIDRFTPESLAFLSFL